MPGPPTEEQEGEGARDAKRARGEPEQDLSAELPIPSADGTLTTPEIPVLPSDAIPSSSTSIPNSPGVSSGSGLKRAHGESVVNDDGEQPGTRALVSNLIAGLHGVDAAEDDEICNCDGIPDEWLSSWYPETHMSQKMVTQGNGKIQKGWKCILLSQANPLKGMLRGRYLALSG